MLLEYNESKCFNLLWNYVTVDEPYKEMDECMYDDLWKIPKLSHYTQTKLPDILIHVRNKKYVNSDLRTVSNIVSCASIEYIETFATSSNTTDEIMFFLVDTSMIENYVYVPDLVEPMIENGHEFFDYIRSRIFCEREYIIPYDTGLLTPIAECRGLKSEIQESIDSIKNSLTSV